MDIRLAMKGGRLVAADALSAEDLAGIREGETVRAQITRPRNIGHHRWFWALMTAVYHAQQEPVAYPTVQHMVRALKIALGLFDTWRVNGRDVLELRSISFAKMSQDEFSQFSERAVELVLTRIVPHVQRADLEARILDILGTSAGRAAA